MSKNTSRPIEDAASKFQPGQAPTVATVGRGGVKTPKPKTSPGGYVGSLGGKPKVPIRKGMWSADLPMRPGNS